MQKFKKYYFPIVIRNKSLKSFNIGPGVKIRRMTSKEHRELFGVVQAEFTFCDNPRFGWLLPSRVQYASNIKGRLPKEFGAIMRFEESHILASRFLIEVEVSENNKSQFIDGVNLAFKLLRPTSTGIWVGFPSNESGVTFHRHNPLNGMCSYLQLRGSDTRKLKRIYQLISKNEGDNKFNLSASLYVRALLGDKTEIDVKFLLLVFALEALYLPKRETELSFRLSLYVTKLLPMKIKGLDTKELFGVAKKIYQIRSDLVHSGRSSNLSVEYLNHLIWIVYRSLNLYLEDKILFSHDSLTNICLE